MAFYVIAASRRTGAGLVLESRPVFKGAQFMKRIPGRLVLILAIFVFCGAAYGGPPTPKEIAAEGIVPSDWGVLKFVLPGPQSNQTQLLFEDRNGTIRIVTLTKKLSGRDEWAVILENVPVIKRR
jgi:hypothetical protein